MSEDSHSIFGPLPARDGEAPFAEPWQAQLLGVAFSLAEAGVISPAGWSEALGVAIERARAAGRPDTQATYYDAALEALESLLGASGVLDDADLAERVAAWRRAYLATPHGHPVELHAGEP